MCETGRDACSQYYSARQEQADHDHTERQGAAEDDRWDVRLPFSSRVQYSTKNFTVHATKNELSRTSIFKREFVTPYFHPCIKDIRTISDILTIGEGNIKKELDQMFDEGVVNGKYEPMMDTGDLDEID